jgi:hypothetical protein
MKPLALAILLLAASAARADEPLQNPDDAEPKTAQCLGGECPTTINDKIFYAYGTLCYGMNYKFLKAVANAESGLNTKQKTYGYKGLFQFDQEGCKANSDEVKSFLDCGDLYDPEINTAAAARRFDDYIAGRHGYQSVLKACPGLKAKDYTAIAYIGHNNGPAVLKHVVKAQACTDEAIKKAITSFYEDNKHSRDDGKYLDGKELKTCSDKSTVGVKTFRCVSAAYGIRKYEFGKSHIASQIDFDKLYVVAPGRDKDCPIETGKRLYDKAALAQIKDLNAP